MSVMSDSEFLLMVRREQPLGRQSLVGSTAERRALGCPSSTASTIILSESKHFSINLPTSH